MHPAIPKRRREQFLIGPLFWDTPALGGPGKPREALEVQRGAARKQSGRREALKGPRIPARIGRDVWEPPNNSRIGPGDAQNWFQRCLGDAGSFLARGGVLDLLGASLEAFWRPPRVLSLPKPSARGSEALRALRKPPGPGHLVRAIFLGFRVIIK